ncbi:HTH domain-containing protein [Haloarcula amylovorans]|uniref:HTH domain-containing protein n=1 Tax=Haloarcula amylovorans TaxID=2562280 RepID=UPI00107625B6|nr:HTH domain-containing protein [Halomicroarcula amylolytica]
MTNNPTQSSQLPTLEFRVRSLTSATAGTKQQEVLDRLDQLEADGLIDEYTVLVWGKEFCPETASGTDHGRTVRDRLAELDEWAARTGLAVAPFFRFRTGHSELLDTTLGTVVHPTMMLAEYVGSELKHVSPCTDGETCHDIDDHLDAIANETARVPTAPGSRPQKVPAIMSELRDAKTSTAEVE